MCGHCGCGSENHIHLTKPNAPDEHQHIHPISTKTLNIEQDILAENNHLAKNNRLFFIENNILTINMLSSPGAGKTTLLEQSIKHSRIDRSIYVIEGDQQTLNDAKRIEKAGAIAIQINTGTGCHLDANMIKNAIDKLQIKSDSLLIIENVGNLVCPALFDLGELQRIVIISVTEGDDKPLKYPNIFENADICIFHKTDLLPYVDFNIDKAKQYVNQINKDVKFFNISSKTLQGFNQWLNYLQQI